MNRPHSNRPPEALEDLILRVTRDARAVGTSMGPDRLAFAIHAGGWRRTAPTSAGLGDVDPELRAVVTAFARNMDPADVGGASVLAEVIGRHGFRRRGCTIHRGTRRAMSERTA